MFENCKLLPDDPILGLTRAYAEDTNAHKIDLGAGVYQNESGLSVANSYSCRNWQLKQTVSTRTMTRLA